MARASAALLGMIEGLAGYGFSTLAKIILFISSSVAGLAIFRVIERLGKGFRGPPRDAWAVLSPGFKRYLIPAGIFSLAYFSFGFLLLRAHSVGFTVKDIVLLYALFNIAFVVAAPLIGRLGDKVGRARMIMLGYLIYLLMSLGFAFAAAQWQLIVLFITYGVFFAIDEAQSKAFIADLEQERRASAIGLYNFVTGLLYLPASLIAGALWLLHPASAFLLAAGLAFAARA